LWECLLAHAANDGEFGVLVLPRPAHWSSLLDFEIPDPQAPNSYVVHPYFARDEAGEPIEGSSADYLEDAADDPHGTKTVDGKRSAEAYHQYARDAKARRLPFVVQIMAAEMCLPIGLDPATGKVDAFLVRSEHTARALNGAGFEFTSLSPGDSSYQWASQSYSSVLQTVGAKFTLLQLFVPGKVLYQVADAPVGKDGSPSGPMRGFDTTMNGQEAMIDLEAEFGLTEVPGGYFYGAHHPNERDPDKKGYPYIFPLLGLIRGSNQTLSSIGAHAFSVGFGGYFADVSRVAPELWTEMGRPEHVDIVPNKVTYVVGAPIPASHPGVSPEVERLVERAIGMLEQQSPTGLTGNPDASGFGQAVAAAGGEVEIGQVMAGATMGLKCIAENLLRQASCISEEVKGPVPVYSHIDHDGTRKDLVEITSKDLAGDFTVDITFPQKKGSNLPLAQAMYQWMQGQTPAISHYTWLQDGYGEESPEEEMDRIWVEKTLASDQGQQMIMEAAARYQGDKELARIAKLKQQGQLTPGGMPTAMMPPRSPRQSGMQSGTAGIEQGNPAISALGGVMAGATQNGSQANVMQATGQGADTSPVLNGAAG
jgi:hypothetical protein